MPQVDQGSPRTTSSAFVERGRTVNGRCSRTLRVRRGRRPRPSLSGRQPRRRARCHRRSPRTTSSAFVERGRCGPLGSANRCCSPRTTSSAFVERATPSSTTCSPGSGSPRTTSSAFVERRRARAVWPRRVVRVRRGRRPRPSLSVGRAWYLPQHWRHVRRGRRPRPSLSGPRAPPTPSRPHPVRRGRRPRPSLSGHRRENADHTGERSPRTTSSAFVERATMPTGCRCRSGRSPRTTSSAFVERGSPAWH